MAFPLFFFFGGGASGHPKSTMALGFNSSLKKTKKTFFFTNPLSTNPLLTVGHFNLTRLFWAAVLFRWKPRAGILKDKSSWSVF